MSTNNSLCWASGVIWMAMLFNAALFLAWALAL